MSSLRKQWRTPHYRQCENKIAYSKTERVTNVDDIQHPAIRNAMKMLDMHEIRLTYEADLPARSGLGTSSSFAVGMLNAFYALKGKYARTGMEYVLIGDYYLPVLKLPRTRPIGRWGMLHKAYLKLRKPAYYQSLLLSGKLDTVLADVEEQATERYEVLIAQMSQLEGISEKLKEENQMEWVRRMSNLENRAAEIVKTELIYPFEGR